MKILKFLSVGIGLLLVLFIAGSIIISMIDPNTFKPLIIQKARMLTGRDISIQGPLKWRFKPNVTLEINQIDIKNAAGFSEPFLQIKAVHLAPRWTSIFTGKLLLSIELKKMALYLTTSASGQNNWLDIQERLHTEKGSEKKSRVLISALHVADAELHYRDAQKQPTYTIQIPKLQTGKLELAFLGAAVPISAEFSLQANHAAPINIVLESNFKVRDNAQTLEGENLHIKANLPNGPLDLNGYFQVTQLNTTPILTGNVEIPDLHVSRWMAAPGKTISKPDYSGDDSLKMTVRAEKGKLTVNPYVLKIANGIHHGQLQINLQGNISKVTLTQEAKNVDIYSLLSILQKTQKIRGKANTQLKLASEGHSIEQWVRNLSGTIYVSIEKGYFLGIDLVALLEHSKQSAQQLVKTVSGRGVPLNLATFLTAEILEWKNQKASSAELKTPFDSLTANGSIRKGIIDNSNLKIIHPKYQITGSGAIDLIANTLQYNIAALLISSKKDVAAEKVSDILKNTPLTIRIYGALDNPTIQPDLEKYVRNAIRITPDKIIEQFSEKLLEKVLGF